MDKQTFQGIWWNPERYEIDPDDLYPTTDLPAGVVAGEATFSPTQGGSLEIIGRLSEEEHLDHGAELPSADRIFGVTIEGRKVTLEKCQAANRTTTMSQVISGSEVWYFQRMMDGVHRSDDSISKMKIEFAGLDNWVAFEFETKGLEPDDEYEQEIKTATANLDGANLTVRAINRPDPYSYSLGPDETNIEFEFDEPSGIEKAISDYLFPFQNLLTLAYDRPVHPTSVSGFRQDTKSIDGFDIYYHHQSLREDLDGSLPAFRISDLNFEKSMQPWFDFANQNKQIQALVFGTRYVESPLRHLEFLSLIISLESIHRRMFSTQHLMDKEEFSEYRSEVINSLPDAPVTDRVEGLIRNIGNEPSLRTRLEEIGERYEDNLPDSFDFSDLFKQAVNNRHALAHGLDSVDANELQPINSGLRFTISLTLLDTLGFEDQELVKLAASTVSNSPLSGEEQE